MSRKSSRRTGRHALTRDMLLPLPTGRSRALSLEHHLALTTIAQGHRNVDAAACLLKALYMAFYLREEMPAGADKHPFWLAEAALDRYMARAEQGEMDNMPDDDKAAIAQILLLHDAQLAVIPTHRYLAALDKLNRFDAMGQKSPLGPPPDADTQAAENAMATESCIGERPAIA
jgi:hypothetical protein